MTAELRGAQARTSAPAPAGILAAVARLDAWLESMRQPGGYGGPVCHWWQSRYRYAGPGLDWRYEGILIGYSTLLAKTGATLWQDRLERAARDLLAGQTPAGHYLASSFEANPGTLGTPHEAAATLGLLTALPHLNDKSAALAAAGRNLDALIAALWDSGTQGFNDRPRMPGRVPNKLATLAQTLFTYAGRSGDESYLPYAKAALEDVLRLQVKSGRFRGAVHQYAADSLRGDARFFPYYNARCIPPLAMAAEATGEPRYLEAAREILGFLQWSMTASGAWPQIVYGSGRRARWPRWIAGAGDILLAFHCLGEPVPQAALARLLGGQLASGGFRSAEGFGAGRSRRALPDFRDLTPVVGWNDKAFRLLCALLPESTSVPGGEVGVVREPVAVGGRAAVLHESPHAMRITGTDLQPLFEWHKGEPWARVAAPAIDRR